MRYIRVKDSGARSGNDWHCQLAIVQLENGIEIREIDGSRDLTISVPSEGERLVYSIETTSRTMREHFWTNLGEGEQTDHLFPVQCELEFNPIDVNI